MNNSDETNEDRSAVGLRAGVPAGSIVFQSNAAIVTVTSIIAAAGMGVFWEFDSPIDLYGMRIVWLASGIAGLILGYRTYRLGEVQIVRAALGVSWRIGVFWVVLAALVEYVLTDQTATATVNQFPKILLPLMLIVGVHFSSGM